MDALWRRYGCAVEVRRKERSVSVDMDLGCSERRNVISGADIDTAAAQHLIVDIGSAGKDGAAWGLETKGGGRQ